MKKVLSILVLALVAVQSLPLPVMSSLRIPSSFR